MKKIVFYLSVFLSGLIIQFSWNQFLNIHGLAPNFILIMLIYIGLRQGPMAGQLIGFAWGISWDAFSVDLFGSHALLFTCIGYFCGQLSHKWNESKTLNQVALTLISSLFVTIGMVLLYYFFKPEDFFIKLNFVQILQPFYTMLFAPVVFLIGNMVLYYLNMDQER